uniref:Uncharacterized protein n=1 Tax=Chromera velia CCMP2878 TaxID=1169474 RepID=A0A0G4F9F2_9ALVE|eukprot:Cvel_194.t1-p1 / transcript=Cvel_194.t1 / gene=Cvel_194 / organism=Chromera_velia_CCMP2878 / gene_product=hypothetical protein / transcript_product=hypothetical protein / location=Cvel_scaffold11:225804-226985(-) / protein_length=114 / sequence_SO=supercontig / SO=protein_coding / is_pseudo=false
MFAPTAMTAGCSVRLPNRSPAGCKELRAAFREFARGIFVNALPQQEPHSHFELMFVASGVTGTQTNPFKTGLFNSQMAMTKIAGAVMNMPEAAMNFYDLHAKHMMYARMYEMCE